MAYSVINKTGCCEHKGHPQIRFDMFLEPDDPRYEDTYVQVPVIPKVGYPNAVDKEGNPLDKAIMTGGMLHCLVSGNSIRFTLIS